MTSLLTGRWVVRVCCTAAVFMAATSGVQTADAASPALTPVASIDLNRYQGSWYQLALYPNRFQAQCMANTRALYALQEDGTVSVTNQCRAVDGKAVEAVGQAKPAAAASVSQGQLAPPQLKVRFAPRWLAWLPLVWGDYWVIQLAADYRYAVVGEPQREFLWVLARSTSLVEADWAAINARLTEQGYDPSRLVREKHTP